MNRSSNSRRDEGSILPLVLVITVVMAVVVAGVADYTTTGLRYGQVVEARADRLAAADGGMRYAVERLKHGEAALCATSANQIIEAPDLNGATVEVTCGPAGAASFDANGWALILTGEGIPTDPAICNIVESAVTVNDCGLLRTQSGVGDPKNIDGPVFMADLTFAARAPAQFNRSLVTYTSTAPDCNNSAPPPIPSNITFDDDSALNPVCETWDQLFKQPTHTMTAAVEAALTANPPYVLDSTGQCRVFYPGKYTAVPALGQNNYFMSGNYVFDGVVLNLSSPGKIVTAGRVQGDFGDTLIIPNTACQTAMTTDTIASPLDAGATFYFRNQSRIVLGSNSSFEILRRKQGASYVSVHVLDGSYTWNTNVIEQNPGSNKSMAIHGKVWAPEASISFDEVSNAGKGQLMGGAVVSNINLRSAANTDGFVISIEPTDITTSLALDSTATLDGHTTTIRSIVDFRPSTRYTAVTSWRVTEN